MASATIYAIILKLALLVFCVKGQESKLVNYAEWCSWIHQCNEATYNRKCNCDDLCGHYRDCCFDKVISPPHLRTPFSIVEEILGIPPQNQTTSTDVDFELPHRSLFECSSNNYFVVSRCPRRKPIVNENFVIKCEDASLAIEDPSLAIPFTDFSTNVTYRNKYCALCNRAENKYLRAWDMNVYCPEVPYESYGNLTTSDERIEELLFNPDTRGWGVWNDDESMFYDCHFTTTFPKKFKFFGYPRLCVQNLVSECSSHKNYTEERTRCIYGEYAPVYVKKTNKDYKNVYCALCNEDNLEDVFCLIQPSYGGGAVSFSLLLNFQLPNQEDNEEEVRCNAGERLYLGKCRKVRCLPGAVFMDGKCLKN